MRPTSKQLASAAPESAESNILLLAEMKRIAEDIKEMKISIDKQSDLAFENSDRLKKIEEVALKQENIIEKLLVENKTLKERVNVLEARLNQAEQAQLSNSIEIRGISPTVGETPEGLVCSIGAALGIKLAVEDLDYVERKRSRREDPRPPPIVVRFVRQTVRDEVIHLRKVKRDFSTRHLGRDTDDRIYLSEEMSPGNKHLYWLARQKRAEGKMKYLWFAGGKIKYRRQDGSPVIIVNRKEDLEAME